MGEFSSFHRGSKRSRRFFRGAVATLSAAGLLSVLLVTGAVAEEIAPITEEVVDVATDDVSAPAEEAPEPEPTVTEAPAPAVTEPVAPAVTEPEVTEAPPAPTVTEAAPVPTSTTVAPAPEPATTSTTTSTTSTSTTSTTTTTTTAAPAEVAPVYPSSPTIVSDKLDYPPGGLVTLTGAGWYDGPDAAPVHIFVNDDDFQSWSRTVDVPVAPGGTITDAFNLPSYFVANYRVTASQLLPDGSTIRVVTTFTDAPKYDLDFVAAAPSTYDHLDGSSLGDLAYDSRIIGTDVIEQLNGGDFTCGDTVVFMLAIGATDAGVTQDLTFVFDFNNDTGVFFEDISQVYLNSNPPDSAVFTTGTLTATASLLTAPNTVLVEDVEDNEELVLVLEAILGCDPNGTVTGNIAALLDDASGTVNGTGFQGGGNQNIPVQSPGALLADPTLILIKQVLGGGPAVADDFTLTATGPTSRSYIGDDGVVQSLNAGTYTLSETTDPFYSPSVWDCGAHPVTNTGTGTATITVASNQDVICRIVNTFAATPPNLTNNIVKTNNANGDLLFTDSESMPEPGGSVPFSVTITNPTDLAWSLVSLVDDHGTPVNAADDISDAGGGITCPSTTVPAGESLTCTFTYAVIGNAGAIHVNTVTGVVSNIAGPSAPASDTSTVTLTDVPSSISVVKTAGDAADGDTYFINQPGGPVSFTVVVTNTSDVDDVTLDEGSFTDKVGDDPATPVAVDCDGSLAATGLPVTLAPAESVTCTFVRDVVGAPNLVETDTVTVTGSDDDGGTPSDFDDAVVAILDVPSAISVVKTAGNAADGATLSIPEPGAPVTFTVVVDNVSLVDSVTISSSSFKDAVNGGAANSVIVSCDVALPVTLSPTDAPITCTFNGAVVGNAGDIVTDVVTVSGTDSDGQSVSGADDAVVDLLNVAPVIVVTKSAAPSVVPETGGTVTFTVEVENTGVEAVTLTSLVDDRFGDLEGQGTCDLVPVPVVLAPGESYSCSFDKVLASDSLTAHTNVVTAVAVDDDGTTATDTDDATVTFTDVAPVIVVTKSAAPSVVPETGGTVTFTVEVENTGVEAVTLTSLVDDRFGDLEGQGTCDLVPVPVVLAPGESYSCSFDKVLASDSLTAHTNVVTAVAVDDDGTTATDTDDATVTFTDVAPVIVVTKSAAPSVVPETGGTVTFTVEVENTGVEAVTLTSLVDDRFGDLEGQGTCDLVPVPVVLAPGESYSCSFDKVLASDSLTAHTNVVTAVAVDDDGTTATDTDDATVTFTDVAPVIVVTKSAAPSVVPETGGTVTFTVEVENTGVEAVTLTSLVDDRFGDLEGQGTCDLVPVPVVLAPGESYSCSFDKVLASDSLTAHTNVVTAVAVDDDGTTATDTDDATVTFTDVAPVIVVTKSAAPSVVPETGGTVTFTVEVENTGVEAVTLTSLVDDRFGDLEGQGTCDLVPVPVVLAPGESYSCSFDKVLASDSLTAHTNVVTAVAVDDDGTTATDTDDATVTFTDVAPVIVVTKSAAPSVVPETGGTVTFTVEVENTGVEAVTLTSLVDDRFGDLEGQGTCDLVPVPVVLAPGESYSCSFDKVLASDSLTAHTNVVTAVAVDDDGTTATDTDDATVTFTDVAPVIVVTKSAAPSVVPETGGTVTFTVEVENTGVEAVTLTSLVDDRFGDLEGQGTCDLVPVPVVLAPGESYSCSFDKVLASDSLTAHTNVVTAVAVDDDGTTATDTDDATVTFTDVAPVIVVTKSAAPSVVPETGGTVTFTVEVENTGVEAVTLTSLVDDRFGDLEGQGTCDLVPVPVVLAPGESYSCSFDKVLASDSLTAHTNVVTAVAVDDDGTTATDTDDATVTFTDVAPVIVVTKSAAPSVVPETGGTVTFTVEVENTGVEAVTLTSLVDDRFGDLEGQGTCDLVPVPVVLAPGESYSCSFDKVLASDSLTAHTNVVTAVAVDDDGTTATDTDDATVTFTDVAPVIVVTKSAAPSVVPETGGTVTFTVEVENTGVEAVTLTSLVDDRFGDLEGQGTCDLVPVPVVLAPGESYSCSFDKVLASDSLTAHTNVVTAVAVDDDGTTATDTDDATVTFTDVAPVIVVTKSAAPSVVPETGGTVTFTVEVENTGVEAVTLTSLVDDRFGDLEGQGTCDLVPVPVVLAPGESYSCSFDKVLASDSLTAHTNVVTAVAVDDDGTTATDTDDATVTFTDVAPVIVVTKSAAPSVVPETGGTVTFTVEVENTGVEAVTLTSLVDDRFGDLEGQGTCDLVPVPVVLAPGESYSCSFDKVLASDSLTAHTNVVTAVAVDDDGTTATDTDDATVTFTDVAPVIVVTKSAAPSVVPETGGTVTFTVEVENTGVEAVTLTSLVDDRFGDLEGQGTCDLVPVPVVLAPGESYSCSFDKVLASDSLTAHTNVVTAVAVDDDGTTATDTDDATVTFTDVAPVIVVTKSAAPSVVPETGGTVTFTVEVENTGVEAVTLTSLVDDRFGDLEGQGTCDLVPVPVVLAPGESYSCSFDKVLASDSLTAHTNVVTAVAVDDDGTTATDTDDATVTFTDVAPVIVVTKSAAPSVVPETGGTVTFTVEVENTGVEAVTLTSLVDDRFGDLEGQGTCDLVPVPVVLAPGESYSCSFDKVLASDSLTAHTNVVTAVAVDDDGTTATDTDDATVTFTDVAPVIVVTKSAAPSVVPETGGTVTFTVEVENTGVEAVTLTSLVDDRFGDLEGQGTCDLVPVPVVLAPGESYSCSFDKVLASDSLTAHTNVVTAVAVDDDGTTATDTDDATVTFTDVAPTVTIVKSAVPGTRLEPGGAFVYTLVIDNDSPEAVAITALTDNYSLSPSCLALVTSPPLAPDDGDGLGAPDGGPDQVSCTYVVSHTDAGTYDNTASVTVEDNDGTTATDSDDETVTVSDVLPTISVVKTASPTSLPPSGGTVTYSVSVNNESVEPVTLSSLIDDRFGNLDGQGTCDVTPPVEIVVGGSYSCTFTKVITGTMAATGGYTPHVNVVEACVADNELNEACGDDDATVTFTWRGRTPGYWKNHPREWNAPYTTSTLVQNVFAIPACLKPGTNLDLSKPTGADTLLQALSYQGGNTILGKAQIMLRAAVAALLNEAEFGNDFPPYATNAALIAAVNAVLATCDGSAYTTLGTTLDNWNNGIH